MPAAISFSVELANPNKLATFDVSDFTGDLGIHSDASRWIGGRDSSSASHCTAPRSLGQWFRGSSPGSTYSRPSGPIALT